MSRRGLGLVARLVVGVFVKSNTVMIYSTYYVGHNDKYMAHTVGCDKLNKKQKKSFRWVC
jgi:hypothetical protein